MSNLRVVRTLGLLLVPGSLAASVPVTVGSRGLEVATAACQDGTCCTELGSTCIVGEFQREDRYYKSSGSCKDPKQPAPPP
jgi:hypothetical protein